MHAPTTPTTPATPLVRARPQWVALRRCALFLAFLISGGLLLFPREPILLLLVALCLAVTGLRLPLRRQMWPLLLLLAAVGVVTLLRTGPLSVGSLVSRATNFAAAVFMLNMYLRAPPGALAGDLLALLRWLAIQALATVVLAHAVGGLFVPITIGEQSYQTLLLLFNYHVTIEELGGLIRPDGFFFEPGVFQIYLNLYLYLTLFVARRPGQALLATLAVLSTQSTTGIVICAVLLGGALWQRLGSGSLRHRALAVLLGVAMAPPLIYLTVDNVSEKLVGTAQGSSWAREYDFFTGLNVIAEHPWLGIGFDVGRYLEVTGRVAFEDTLLDSAATEERPTSNGLIHLFYSLGIPLGLLFAWGMFKQMLFAQRWLIGVWLALSMFGESVLFTPFFLMIVLSAYLVRRAPARAMRRRPGQVSGQSTGQAPALAA